jgi:hypothetical protein
VKNYLYQRQKLDENVKKAFTIVYKQCTENLKSKLEQSPEWALLSVNCDVLALMELIRSMVFKYEDRMFQPLSLHRVKQSYYSFRQGGLSNVEYLQAFKNRYEMANSHGVVLYDEEVGVMLMKQNPTDATKDFDADLTQAERDVYLQQAKDLCQAIAFLSQSDQKRYSELLSNLQNDHTKGKHTYPKNLTKAYQYLNDYKVKPMATTTNMADGAVAFTQQHANGKGTEKGEFPAWMKGKTCHICGEDDHISTVCSNKDKEADEEKNENDSSSASSKSKADKAKKAAATGTKAKKKTSFVQ